MKLKNRIILLIKWFRNRRNNNLNIESKHQDPIPRDIVLPTKNKKGRVK